MKYMILNVKVYIMNLSMENYMGQFTTNANAVGPGSFNQKFKKVFSD